MGLIALGLNYWLLEDPEYLKEERREMRSRPLNFDSMGLGLIIIVMSTMEVILSKGQEWDWFGDTSWRVQILTAIFAASLVGMIVWESNHKQPILNLGPFKDRNFVACGVVAYVAFAILYASMTLLPGMLQNLFGYNAEWSGLVMSPAGLFSIPTMAFVGFLIGKRVDARWLIMVGALLMAGGAYWFAHLNTDVSPSQIVWPRVVQQLGTSFMFAPLSVAAFIYLPKELRGAAAGIFAVLRNEGGSFGTSMGKTLVQRRLPLHTDRLGETLNPLYTPFNDALQSGQTFFEGVTGDPVSSQAMALAAIDHVRQQQAETLAYLDGFYVFAILALAIIPLALLMRRSVAEPGQHVGVE
jgi:DHA2 family multidrug resistance protein